MSFPCTRGVSVATILAIAVTLTGAITAVPQAHGETAGDPPPLAVPYPPEPHLMAAESGPPGAVTLITGDRVFVSTGAGVRAGGIVPAAQSGPAAAMLSVAAGGQPQEIPADAVPYLGHGLDPGLFSMGRLVGAERGGRLPVTIGYHGRLPRLPGVTIISAGHRAARGYLTPASARAFGAALAQQYLADRGSGGFGNDGMFAGGVQIALPGQAPRPAAGTGEHPGTNTVTITGTNEAGQPANGDPVALYNVDVSGRFDSFSSQGFFRNGLATFTNVPNGHYWAAAIFFAPTGASVRQVVLPQFTVSGNTRVHMAARAATSKVTVVTPRPARPVLTTVTVVRFPGKGVPTDQGATVFGSASQYVTPVPDRPGVGSIRLFPSQQLVSPPGSGVPYQYALTYGSPQGTIPVRERYVVRASSLATVHESFFQSAPSAGQWWVNTLQTRLVVGLASDRAPVSLPGTAVLYAGTNVPGLTWQTQYYAVAPSGAQENGEYQNSLLMTPGQRYTGTWNRYPLHPDANTLLSPEPFYYAVTPSASIGGNMLRLDTSPFTDSQLGDNGTGFGSWHGSTVTGSYQVDQGGRKIASGNPVTVAGGANALYLQVPLHSTSSAPITFRLTAARSGRDFPLATASQTAWTWRPVRHPGAKLPPGWDCLDRVPKDLFCTVQPMMTLEYDVARLDLKESAPAGRQELTITVGHLQLAKAAQVTGAKVQVSFDAGKTWHLAKITPLGNGRFRATFTAPAKAKVALRTIASDTAGGSIRETITGAYVTG